MIFSFEIWRNCMKPKETPKIELSLEKTLPFLITPAPIALTNYCYDDLAGIAYHTHSGNYELAVITRGYGYHYINGIVSEVTKGSAFLIDPDSYHSFYPIDSQNSSRLTVLNCVFGEKAFLFLYDAIPQLKNALDFFSKCPSQHPLSIKRHYLGKELSEYCSFILSRLIKTYEGKLAIDHPTVTLSIAQILLEAYQLFSTASFLENEKEMNPLVTEALLYLHQHWNDTDFFMEALYQHLYVSKSHLCTLFKQAMGITPINYLNRMRIQKACEMIHENPDSIDNVYTAVGYTQYSTFYVNFKNYTGFSIRDYCKALKLYDNLNN